MGTDSVTGAPERDVGEIEAFLYGKLAMAAGIAHRCADDERAERMTNAVTTFCEQLEVESADEAMRELQRRSLEWETLERRMLLVDLWSVDAFSPYEIKASKADQRAALHKLASSIDAAGAIGEIDRCARELRNSARIKAAIKISGVVAGSALVVGGAGFIAAPFIGAALGASAGLSGAAATSSGLAILGGGSLAAGGSGVAGGIMLVTATGATVGGVAGGGGLAMYQLGARQAQIELRKMELKFKVALLQTQAALVVAQGFATHLHDEIDDLRKRLDEERRYSEKRSERITSLERLLKQFEEAESWMTDELAEAAS